jgi:hypothetical protein
MLLAVSAVMTNKFVIDVLYLTGREFVQARYDLGQIFFLHVTEKLWLLPESVKGLKRIVRMFRSD